MTTVYKFKAYYTDAGVGTVQDPAPTCTVINMADDSKLADAQATTASTNMPGLYSYEYSGADGLDCVAWFKTTDTGCDVKELASYVSEKITTNLNADVAGVETKLDTVDSNVDAILADTGTDGVVLKAAGLAADAVTKIQNGLALEATLTAIKGAGWTTESLKVIRDALTAVQADLDNPNQYKADVSALATTTHLQEVEDKVDTVDTVADEIKLKTDKIPAVPAQAGEYTAAIAAIPTTPLLAANYTAPDNASISAIKAKTDTIPASPAVAGEYTASIAAIQADLDNPNQYKADVSGIPDAILAKVVVDTLTLKQVLKVLAAIEIGTTTGGGTASFTYTGKDGTTVQLTGVDENGNRTAVIVTPGA